MSDEVLRGRRVAVTGGASGIGLAVSRALIAVGARVAAIDVNDAALAVLANDHRSEGLTTYRLDVTDPEASHALARRIEDETGPVYGLVTSAGITAGSPSIDMGADTWQRVIDVNLSGTFFSAQAFARGMIARNEGAIVLISSASGLGGQAGRANYVASKWGVIGLAKTLAIEWGGMGIRVNAVAPGPIDTELFRKIPERFREEVLLSRTPLHRAAQPQEVADVIMFLLGPAARFVNGSVLTVDGGFTSGFATHDGGGNLALPR